MNLFKPGGILSALLLLVSIVFVFARGVTSEIQVGSVSGRVLMPDGKKAAPNAVVVIESTAPADPYGRVENERRVTRTNEKGEFRLRNLPIGTYWLSANTRRAAATVDEVKIENAKFRTLNLTLEKIPLSLNLSSAQRVFLPREKPLFNVSGATEAKSLHAAVYEVPMEKFHGNAFQEVFEGLIDRRNMQPLATVGLTKVQEFDLDLTEMDGDGGFQQELVLKQLPEGVYWLATSVTEKKESGYRGAYFAISQLGLIEKIGESKTMVQVVDLDTGKAVSDVPVFQGAGGTAKNLGQTDQQGILDVPDSPGLYALRGKSLAIIDSRAYARSAPSIRSVIYTDRPIYRPGDEVQFKVLLRTPSGNAYKVPTNVALTGRLVDPEEVESTVNVTLGPDGTLTGSFAMKNDVVGGYSLEIGGTVDGQVFSDSKYIEARAYRKPEFKITVSPRKKSYTTSDMIEMEVSCENYFGGPVVGAEISGSVYVSPHWSWDWDFDPGYGEFVSEVAKLHTDDEGKAIIRFPANKLRAGNLDESSSLQDWDVVFEVYGEQGDGKYFDGKGKVSVYQGQIGIQTELDHYVVKPGEPMGVTAKVVTNDESKPVANQKVKLEYGYYEWDKRRSHFVKQGETTGQTDSQGSVHLSAPAPDASDVELRITTKDATGATVGATTSLWVSSDYGHGGELASLEVKLDRPRYQEGQVAQALILTDKPGGDALVTLEGRDVLWRSVVPLTGRSTMVSVPLKAGAFPGATVSVVRVHQKEFQESYASVKLFDKTKELSIAISSDKAVYEPGQKATYRVHVTDSKGAPVSTDLSLALVDESIFAISEDSLNLKEVFYPERGSLVSTLYSFPEVYLDGGDKEVDASKLKKFGEVRKKFRDTAAWVPHLRTNAAGEAITTVTLPDNLGSWRATAVAMTTATQVGIGRQNVKVRKPLMARLSLPTMLTEGDELSLDVLVTNQTGSNQMVDVHIETGGRLKLTGDPNQKVSIAEGETKTVSWPATVVGEGPVEVAAGVLAGSYRDSVLQPVQISTRKRIKTEYASGVLPAGGEGYSHDFRGNLRTLRINAANHVSDLVRGASVELMNFDYLCAEQTVSRFLPALVTFTAFGPTESLSESQLNEVMQKATIRLRKLQRGGFTWYDNGDADPEMTAIVLEGLAIAKNLGRPLDIDLASTIKWSGEVLSKVKDIASDRKSWTFESHLHLAAALLLHDPQEKAARNFIDQAYKQKDLSVAEQLLVGQGLVSMKDSRADDVLRKVGDHIAGQADIAATSTFWDADRVNGRALLLLSQMKGGHPAVQRLLGYAVANRRGHGWMSSRDTTEMVLGLVAAQQSLGSGRGQFEVLIDGKVTPLENGTLTMKGVESANIEIRNTGAGPAYYTIEVESFEADDSSSAIQPAGLTATRTFHGLDVVRLSDNSPRLVASKNARDAFMSGRPVREVFSVTNNERLNYVMITLPRVSGLEPADDPTADYWDMWYSGIQIFDDRITLFAAELEPGTHIFEVNYRAEKPGNYVVRRATIAPMYQPDFKAQAAPGRLKVVP